MIAALAWRWVGIMAISPFHTKQQILVRVSPRPLREPERRITLRLPSTREIARCYFFRGEARFAPERDGVSPPRFFAGADFVWLRVRCAAVR
jgi:hypothetical protein